MENNQVQLKWFYSLNCVAGNLHSPFHMGLNARKVLLVRNGGTLELHGKKKTSWTRLAQSIPRLTDLPCAFVYDHSDHKVLFTAVIFEFIDRRTNRHTDSGMANRQMACLIRIWTTIPFDRFLSHSFHSECSWKLSQKAVWLQGLAHCCVCMFI